MHEDIVGLAFLSRNLTLLLLLVLVLPSSFLTVDSDRIQHPPASICSPVKLHEYGHLHCMCARGPSSPSPPPLYWPLPAEALLCLGIGLELGSEPLFV